MATMERKGVRTAESNKNWVYLVFVSPTIVMVKEELFNMTEHMKKSIFFEVPEQEQTFGLPSGNVRVIVRKFDEALDIRKMEVFSIQDITKAPELYRRLNGMLPK